MEKLYRCKYTKNVFDNEWDCIISEYENGEEQKKFFEMFDSFLETIQNKYGVKVFEDTLQRIDTLHKNYDISLDRYRFVSFTFELEDKQYTYEKTSDTVGDGRWEWFGETVQELEDEFKHRFVLPLHKKFEGFLAYEYNHKTRKMEGTLNGYNLGSIISLLANKKVEIKVLQEPAYACRHCCEVSTEVDWNHYNDQGDYDYQALPDYAEGKLFFCPKCDEGNEGENMKMFYIDVE